jgi:pimeloyl-ACP methyl ester carboxylesterase
LVKPSIHVEVSDEVKHAEAGGSVSNIQFFALPNGNKLAYHHENADASGAGILWLSGYKSDMAGTKAEGVAAAARAAGRRCLRFDYSGHGLSSGDFADFTVSDWLEDAMAMFLIVAKGEQIIIGSSMGGYLALLLAKRLQQKYSRELLRLKAIVLIAPAADMTEALLWPSLDEAARREIEQHGRWLMPSRYGDGYVITRKLIEDGRQHLILEKGMAVDFPVRILHGEDDPDVPWKHGLKLFSRLSGNDVSFTLIKGGDHRLSSPGELKMIIDSIETVFKAQP